MQLKRHRSSNAASGNGQGSLCSFFYWGRGRCVPKWAWIPSGRAVEKPCNRTQGNTSAVPLYLFTLGRLNSEAALSCEWISQPIMPLLNRNQQPIRLGPKGAKGAQISSPKRIFAFPLPPTPSKILPGPPPPPPHPCWLDPKSCPAGLEIFGVRRRPAPWVHFCRKCVDNCENTKKLLFCPEKHDLLVARPA